MILLAFRFTKHYWPLGIRQLVMPVGMPGESFPYRSQYVYNNVGPVAGEVGLICAKYDGQDFYAARSSAYVPLRAVTDVTGRLVPGSTVRYFNYRLGPTLDYRDKSWDSFSEGIRNAVVQAMAEAGDPNGVDSDNALVIRCNYPLPNLPGEEETDRWVTQVRMLASGYPYAGVYAGVKDGEELHKRFKSVMYLRVVSVSGVGRNVGSIDNQGRIQLRAGREFSVEAVTNVAPELGDVEPFLYKLLGSTDYFEMINDSSEVSAGILNHRWLARCRRVPNVRTHLRATAEGAARMWNPPTVIPVSIGWSLSLWPQVLGFALMAAGLLLGLVSVLPDGDLEGWVRWTGKLASNLDGLRWWLRTCAILSVTSGIGTWFFNLGR